MLFPVRALLGAALVATSLLAVPHPGSAAPDPTAESAEAPAVREADRWTTSDAMVPVTVGPDDDVDIELDTRLYVPRGASARDPRPAILMTHGFGLTKDGNEVVSTARFLASHGYLVLTWTSSGFGDSGGCITLQSADWDVKGAMQLVDALLEPRDDVLRDRRGLVLGTIGGSYGGGIQLPLAAADPRIRATIPGRTWNTLRYSLDPNNLVAAGDRSGLDHDRHEQGVFKQEWTSLFYASGNSGAPQGDGGCAEAKQASGDPAEIAAAPSCPGFYLEVCRIYELLTATGTTDEAGRDYIARASASTFLDRVDAATLLVQGQSDTLFNLNDAAATYTALRRRGVPVAMTWNSGGHGGYTSQPGECEAYDGVLRSVREMDACYLPRRQLQWFDHYLRGRGSAGPGFTWFEDSKGYDGSGPDDEQYGAARRFPLRGRTTLALGDGPVTIVNPPGGEPGAYTETSNFTGPDSSPSLADVPPSEVEGQHADLDTPPLARAADVVGIPSARLALSHVNGQDLVLFLKVYDVAPDGSAELVHRLITPVRVADAALSQPVDVRLVGFAHRFARGHVIRVTAATTDLTSYGAKVADTITLDAAASTITLPGRLTFG